MYGTSMKGSFNATTWTLGFLSAARKTKRPMRPKPLIPILAAIEERGRCDAVRARERARERRRCARRVAEQRVAAQQRTCEDLLAANHTNFHLLL